MLEDKVAIITGGTRGIGFATAKKFLENGAKVVIFGTKVQSVNEAVEKLKTLNNKYDVIGFYPNLTCESEIKNIFEEIEKKYGKIDILVNNAGISSKTKIEEYT